MRVVRRSAGKRDAGTTREKAREDSGSDQRDDQATPRALESSTSARNCPFGTNVLSNPTEDRSTLHPRRLIPSQLFHTSVMFERWTRCDWAGERWWQVRVSCSNMAQGKSKGERGEGMPNETRYARTYTSHALSFTTPRSRG
jgi:hypothetical protein